MYSRTLLLGVLLALSAFAIPAVAQVNINIDIGVAPPAPRYEVVPAPRSGYVWAPGYWRWEDQRHVWDQGRWIAARPGSSWVADRWQPRDGRHYYEPGHWKQKAKVKKPKHESKGNGKGWAKGHDR
jgi:WXXGXW repeat (2 copies)